MPTPPPYSVARPWPLRHVAAWDLTTEVAVVGFGAAGACAAIEAAEAGRQVRIFEVGAGSGGASALSGGEIYLGGGGGTPAQRAAGYEDTTEALATYLKLAGGPDADVAKVQLYAEHSLDHHDWLTRQGVPFKDSYLPGKLIEPETDDTLIWSGSEEAWPFCEEASPAPRGHVIQMQGYGGGRKLVDILEARGRELGVVAHCSSRVIALVADDQGAVHGLVARIDGVERFVRATHGVVLCTGGFALNPEMVRRYAPEAVRLENPIGAMDDGSGILLGMSVGGDAIHMDQFFTTCPWYPPESLVKGVFVNQHGQRFINEDCYHGRVSRAAVDQPGDRVYLLVDNEIFDRPMELARIDVAAVGDTWAEVEVELSLPPGALTSTVELYNRHAAIGEDPIWRKAAKWLKPLTAGPFAALELRVGYAYFSYFTLGGLNTLSGGEVLDRAGAPILGLYAAGRAACGLPRWGHGYSSGMSLADCTFFGRLAGRSAAARLTAET